MSINIPKGHHTVLPYLVLENASGFFSFVQQVFAATEHTRVMRDETSIMHGEVSIGDSVIMYAGATEEWGAQPGALFVYVNDADKTVALAAQAGAKVIMEVSQQSYGRSGGILDPFGNTWWITTP